MNDRVTQFIFIGLCASKKVEQTIAAYIAPVVKRNDQTRIQVAVIP